MYKLRTLKLHFFSILGLSLLSQTVFAKQYIKENPSTNQFHTLMLMQDDWTDVLFWLNKGASGADRAAHQYENCWEPKETPKADVHCEVSAVTLIDTLPPLILQSALDQIYPCNKAELDSLIIDWVQEAAYTQFESQCEDSDSIRIQYLFQGDTLAPDSILQQVDDLYLTSCIDSFWLDTTLVQHVNFVFPLSIIATDSCGNSIQSSATFITYSPDRSLTFTPLDTTFTCDTTDLADVLIGWRRAMYTDTFSNACPNAILRSIPTAAELEAYINLQVDNNCIDSLEVTILWFVYDPCTEQSSDTLGAAIKFIDNVLPVLTSPARDTLVQCSKITQSFLINWINAQATATVSDNCFGSWRTFEWSHSLGQGSGRFDVGPYPSLIDFKCEDSLQLRFTYKDACGHFIQDSSIFVYQDTIKPRFFAVPDSITLACEAFADYLSIVVGDNCMMDTLFYRDSILVDTVGMDACSKIELPLLRTWTAIDRCGNRDSLKQFIQLMDDEGPIIAFDFDPIMACPTDTINFDSIHFTVFDGCSDQLIVDHKDTIYGTACQRIFSRRVEARDVCDNFSTETQIIFAQDTTPPIWLSAPVNRTVNCTSKRDSIFDQWVNSHASASAADGCSDFTVITALLGSLNPNDLSTYPGVLPVLDSAFACPSSDTVHMITAIVAAYDNCSNILFDTVHFVLIDTLPPSVTTPNIDSLYEANGSNCTHVLRLLPPTVLDDCLDTTNFVLVLDGTDTIHSNGLPRNYAFEIGAHNIQYIGYDCAMQTQIITRNFRVIAIMDTTSLCPDTSIIAYSSNTACDASVPLPLPNLNSMSCLSDSFQMAFRIASINPLWQEWTQQDPQPIALLDVGNYNLQWRFIDAQLDTQYCDVPIMVRDSFPPSVACGPGEIILPLGFLTDTILDPNIFIDNLTDNCAVDSVWMIPSSVNCQMQNNLIDVIIIAQDLSGNLDSCNTMLAVEVESFEILHTINDCNPDTLILSSTIPGILWNELDFQWSGPNGTSSNNPVWQLTGVNASSSGSYTLTVSKNGQCAQMDTKRIDINPDFEPIWITEDTSVCMGNFVQLTIEAAANAVNYLWYSEQGGLLATTSGNSINVWPNLGINQYYVQIETNSCTSQFSDTLTIIGRALPMAIIGTLPTTVCQGRSIQLFASNIDTGLIYEWTGPNAYTSNAAVPASLDDIAPIQAGNYFLRTYDGHCWSAPDSVLINVLARPTKPFVSSPNPKCEGLDLLLKTSNRPLADSFIWINPSGFPQTTMTDSLWLRNIGQAESGYWQLLAYNNGCPSLLSDSFYVTVEQVVQPTAYLVDGVACSSSNMQLAIDDYPNANYHWTGPGGFDSNLKSPTLASTSGTFACEIITAAGCILRDSIEVDVIPSLNISSISNDGLSCVDGSINICFEYITDFEAGVDYTFLWEGPNGFNATDSILCINDAGIADNGIYTLQIFTDACPSNRVTTVVELTDMSLIPPIEGPLEVCQGDEIIIRSEYYALFLADYHWQTPRGEIINKDSFIVIPNAQLDDSGSYVVYLENNDCRSLFSDTIQVDVIPLPDTPNISRINNYCEGETIDIQFNAQADVTYTWITPDGDSVKSAQLFILNAQTGNSGKYSLVLAGPKCAYMLENYFNFFVAPAPNPPIAFNVQDSLCLSMGTTVELCIDANIFEAGVLYNFARASDSTFYSTFDTSRCRTIELNPDEINNNIVEIWTLARIGNCIVRADTPIRIHAFIQPEQEANAGQDILLCTPDMDANISAVAAIQGSGRWVYDSTQVMLDAPNSAMSLAFLNNVDSAWLIWELSNGSCIAYTTDSLLIQVRKPISAEDDFYELDLGGEIEGNIFDNDTQEESTIEILTSAQKGTFTVGTTGAFTYVPNLNQVGVDSLRYKICDLACPDNCAQAKVVFELGDLDNCDVPTYLSPNDDGINDYLLIPCVDNVANRNNHLQIFNEWGDKVFDASPYKNDFNGNYKSNPLPEGTYYFIFEHSEAKAQTGFLILDR